jgi:NodT family efflux transporter outer membrane factor (OMF) lipoprotein
VIETVPVSREPVRASTRKSSPVAAALRSFGLLLPAMLLAIGLAALGGCAAGMHEGPHDSLPAQKDLAAKFQLVPPDQAKGALPSSTWWTSYGDAELDRWIGLGLSDSPGLREAAARVARARAYFDSARAGQGPTVSFGADADEQRISSNGIFPPPLAGMVGTQNDIGLSASYDFDFFGRLTARTDAARLGAMADETDHELARIRLAGAISHAYFDLAHAQQARRVLVELEQSRSKLLDLVRRRVQAGFDTEVERRLAQFPVPQVRVEIERENERIALARHSLALLAGQPPQAADAVEATLPEADALVPPQALPLDLLSRRADIAEAQTRVLAALRGVDAARAEFYPNINLSVLVGLDSFSSQTIFRWSSRVWQIEPAIHLPLFDSGLLKANLRASSAEADQAIAAYNATVLQAVGETADALTSIAAVRRQREQQDEATRSAQAAADLAGIRYEAGLGNLLPVLTAQVNVLAQRRAELDLAARSAALDVNLAMALGGGYGEPRTASADVPADNPNPSAR